MPSATTVKKLLVGMLGAVLVLGVPTAHAQITITRANAEALIGQTFEVETFEADDVSELEAIVDASGANQTYDFSSVSFTKVAEGAITYRTFPAAVPGADDPDFQEANMVFEISLSAVGDAGLDSTLWSFQRIQDDGAYSLGGIYPSGQDVDGDGRADTLTFKNDPAPRDAALPLTFNDSWATGAYQSTIGAGSFAFSNTMSSEHEIDGYGTLIGPDGTEWDALRQRTVTESTSFGFTSTFESINFITKGNGALAALGASIALDAQGNVTSGSFTRATGGDTGTPVQSMTNVPEAFRLEQNYPNPFNPATTIRYALPRAAPVRLAVYDALGREVAVLVDGEQAAGHYHAVFDASDLPSGVYVYRLKTDTFAAARTLLLAK